MASLVTVDSTNFTLATNAVSTVSFGAGFRHVSVVNFGGNGSVSYKLNTDSTTSVSSLAADTWLLPASVGAAWSHDLADDDADSGAPAFYCELVAGTATTSVVVTAWV